MKFIICKTPLHILIAEKIISLHPEDKFYGLMIVSEKNDKHNYYYNRLKKKCSRSIYLKSNNKIKILISLFYFRLIKWFIPKIDTVFFANITSLELHCIVSSLSKANIKTFDDGIANIDKTGAFFTKNEFSQKKKLRRKFLLFCNIDKNYIKERSQEHYTIYKNKPNIISNTNFISLFPKIDKSSVSGEKKIIFLGQPIYELFDSSYLKKYKELVMRTLNFIHADYYFPHPRETQKIDGIEYIETPLIFEDYILKKKQEDTGLIFDIYTFFSTAILNIKDVDGINVISVKPQDFPLKLRNVYKIMENNEITIKEI